MLQDLIFLLFFVRVERSMCYKCALTERWPKTGVNASIISVKKMCCCFVFVFFFLSFERDSINTALIWAMGENTTTESVRQRLTHTQSFSYPCILSALMWYIFCGIGALLLSFVQRHTSFVWTVIAEVLVSAYG